jgi:hypothetical protein
MKKNPIADNNKRDKSTTQIKPLSPDQLARVQGGGGGGTGKVSFVD